MTVFAYRDTFHQEVAENTLQEEVTVALQTDNLLFVPDGADGVAIKDYEQVEEIEVIYEKQFVDMEGNIYPYSDEEAMTTYRSCSHNFVSGTSLEHTKYSDGGGEVREYRSQRCDICGYMIRGEKIRTIIYVVCPH